MVRSRVHVVGPASQPLYSRASASCHCRVLSWPSKEYVMTKATTALQPTVLPLTMTCFLVPTRFHRRPQLLSRREPLFLWRGTSLSHCGESAKMIDTPSLLPYTRVYSPTWRACIPQLLLRNLLMRHAPPGPPVPPLIQPHCLPVRSRFFWRPQLLTRILIKPYESGAGSLS
jgi:hypothetical protein